MKSKTRYFWTFFLLIFLSGCTATTDFVTNPGSTITSHQSSIFMFSLILAAVVFVIVEGGIIIAITRFRRRKEDASEPTQVHGNVPLEIIWTAIPVVLVVILFI